MKIRILLICSLLFPLVVQAADVQYVSDQLVITLRSGQGSEYQILKTLPSGTKLQVLETTDSGYTKVVTDSGDEGWVRSQYLIDEPIAQTKLDRAQTRLERLKSQNAKLKEELNLTRKSAGELDSERKELLSKHQTSSSELKRLSEVAAKPILLDKQNRELKQQNVSLEKDLQLIQQENQVLKDRSQREWFIAGAGVLLGGMILGLLIPKIRWRKKSNW